MTMNVVGRCTACSDPIADVLAVYDGTGNPEVDGAPLRIGPFYPDTRLVTLILANGSRMDISLCEKCAELSSGRMDRVWTRICYSQGKALDPEWVRAKGILPLSDDQTYWVKKSLSGFASNPPLGILAIQRWGDLYDGRSTDSAS